MNTGLYPYGPGNLEVWPIVKETESSVLRRTGLGEQDKASVGKETTMLSHEQLGHVGLCLI